jgi:hypothetical protein
MTKRNVKRLGIGPAAVLFSGTGAEIDHSVVCPACGFEYTRAGTPRVVDGEDDYRAGWGGRGDLIVIPFVGECGHSWELCFGFHKGNTMAFVRDIESAGDEGEDAAEDHGP